MPVAEPQRGPYGLIRPSYADARAALARVHLGKIDSLWENLVAKAGLRTAVPGDAIDDALIRVMISADPVTRLVGQSLQIRIRAYEHLAAAHETIRSAS